MKDEKKKEKQDLTWVIWVVVIAAFCTVLYVRFGDKLPWRNSAKEASDAIDKKKSAYSVGGVWLQAGDWSKEIRLRANEGENIIYVPTVAGITCIALLNGEQQQFFPSRKEWTDADNPSSSDKITQRLRAVRWSVAKGQKQDRVWMAYCTYFGTVQPKGWYREAIETCYYD